MCITQCAILEEFYCECRLNQRILQGFIIFIYILYSLFLLLYYGGLSNEINHLRTIREYSIIQDITCSKTVKVENTSIIEIWMISTRSRSFSSVLWLVCLSFARCRETFIEQQWGGLLMWYLLHTMSLKPLPPNLFHLLNERIRP